jgi:hypothetical protein
LLKKLRWEMLYQLGAFPSTHATSVTSLTTVILIVQGVSPLFIVTLVFSIIVIRDALGVRKAVEKQAKILNKKLKANLYENIGHTPLDIIGGIILGIIVTALIVL